MTLEKWKIGKDILKQYTSVLEDWVPPHASLAIAVNGEFVYYSAGSYDIGLQEGELVEEGGIVETVILTGKKCVRSNVETASGQRYHGIGYPVVIQGEPGVLLVILPPPKPMEQIRLLTGKQDEDWYPIPVEQITHIESFHKKTWFYYQGKQFNTGYTLKELTHKLPVFFLRIHRSYIVNITAVQKISKDFSSGLVLTMLDGSDLPISQTYVNEVRTVFHF